MPQEMTLKLEERSGTGQNHSRRIRREGRLPAVVYGDGKDPIRVSVDSRTLNQVLRSDRGTSTLLNLEFEDSSRNCKALIREIQIEPLQERLLHADFLRVAMDKEIEVAVNLEFTGTPVGVKNEGGVMHARRHEIEVACLPGNIPETIHVDVSGLGIGDEIRVEDLELPEGVMCVTEQERLIVHVVQPTLALVEEEGEEAEEEGEVEAAEEGEEGTPSGDEGESSSED